MCKQKKDNESKKGLHLLSFAFFYFSESLVFNGLCAKKIKNPPPSQLAPRVVRNGLERPVLASSHLPVAGLPQSGDRELISQDSALEKDLRRFRTLANGLPIDPMIPSHALPVEAG